MKDTFKKIKKIHFIGIKGTGMSALANVLKEKGKIITGSDSNGPKETKENIKKDLELIIYSAAVPKTNIERKEGKKKEIKEMSYAEALGLFSIGYETIAICGTHGKTTTTGMISTCLKDEIDPTIIVGANIQELDNKNYRKGKSKYLIIEACEYKRHFLEYKATIVIITNIEIDHLDYFKNEEDYKDAFKEFLLQIKKNGTIIANYDDKNVKEICKEISKKRPDIKIISYSKNSKLFNQLNLSIPGEHNKYNAIAALTATMELTKVDSSTIVKILNKFHGANRRFQEHKLKNGSILIDDYAHHPTAVKKTIEAARNKFGRKSKILCIFQPHQHSRTKKLLKEFKTSFSDANEVIIPNIFTVRDSKKDIEEMTAEKFVEELKIHHKKVLYGNGIKNTTKLIKEKLKDFDVIILMGAGDIIKISKKLTSK